MWLFLSTPLLETAAGVIGPSDLVSRCTAVPFCNDYMYRRYLFNVGKHAFTLLAYEARCKIRLPAYTIPTCITTAGNGQDCTCFHWLGQYYKGVSSRRTGLLIN